MYMVYYHLFAQCLYLLLIIAPTCFGHTSRLSSTSQRVSSTYASYVITVARVMDFIRHCLNIIKTLKSENQFVMKYNIEIF